ncbi:MAG: FliI/YscN family ATPase [Planctomycetes bacterium]|nr:FliI/YscN family ATPase [Planctomycetota bacterium]
MSRTARQFESAVLKTRIRKIVGLLIEAGRLSLPLGSRLSIHSQALGTKIPVELVGFTDHSIFLMPYGRMDGISPGDEAVFETSEQTVLVGEELLGHVLNGKGEVIDGAAVTAPHQRPIYHEAPLALSRRRIGEPFFTGIRAWDAFLTMGRGQRVGVFAGTGVGKSVLLGMIARNSQSDVNVICLVGERGNEVNEFIGDVLGPEGMKKSVVVIATSDQTPLTRVRSAFVAISIAEYFAEQGKNVLFLVDSITRMCMAARELGLSIGEPPTSKGYPPSVFSMIPKLLERAGNFQTGSITSIIAVLLEGDDLQDPIGDAVRGVLDGHVVLDRSLADRGFYPAISIPDSLSRWMSEVADKDSLALARQGRKAIADFRNAEDLINVGAYVNGSNPDIDSAIHLIKPIRKFMTQGIKDTSSPEDTLKLFKKTLSS